MPTYKYKREDGTTFEIRQSINDDALAECPETGQKVKRVISGGGGVVYKGDGFYVTDYKDSDRKEKRAKEKQQSNGTGGCCAANGTCSVN
ncbi:FmdB family zinc ribbon protein [Fodinibius sp. SL11]|uniref:FmdB family zinc ribbon protein n=1 Tax=Fodinibius sp. SL11 TaxID=3425690 RepID=UPI003F8829CD